MKKLEKNYDVFEFIRFPFDLEDNFATVDLSKPEYLEKFYNWRMVIRYVDKQIGRNTLYIILKFLGVFNKYNRPLYTKKKYGHFHRFSNREICSWNHYFPGPGNVYITGYGIKAIRDVINTFRKAGSSL